MEFTIESKRREEIINITQQIKEIVSDHASSNSQICLIFIPHASAAVLVNENYDSSVCEDILKFLKDKIPQGSWEHDKIDGNADSHIKASIIGPSQLVPIKDKKLQLGTWQGIGLAEFDGPRKRKVIVKIL